MDSQPKHGLKIVDTPTEDEAATIDAANDCSIASPAPQSDSKSSQPGRTQRLSPEAMDEEIDRVNRLNGVPTLAKDTFRDE